MQSDDDRRRVGRYRPEVHGWCGTMPVHRRLLDTYPGYGPARAEIENHTFGAAPAADRPDPVTIPVVVHVVWHRPAENISDEQIHSQLTVLDNDFRAANPDASTVPPVWQGLVGNARLRFALASTDPTGAATTGITRTRTPVSGFDTDDEVKSASTGGADAWPAQRYLNMWVCPLRGGLLGYAQFPGGPPETDGVVILHSAFGTTGTAEAPFDGGRTAVHEIGHWLNLRHIWGDDGDGCGGSDFVDDTPNQAGPRTGAPRYPAISCDNGPHGDMFMNYMDYTDDASMVMFTAGQVHRMDACLTGPRSDLLTAAVAPAPPEALFRRWVHVREEDEPGVRVYRPADAAIPPARGRDGIEFCPDGSVVAYRPGPVDAPVGRSGRWEMRDAGRLAVSAQTGDTYEVLGVTDDELRLGPAG